MGDSPFMPGWAWGLTAALVVGGGILIALPEDRSRPRLKGRGYRGLDAQRQPRKPSCGFGQMEDCTTIAVGPKREHITGDPGTFRREWRICCRRTPIGGPRTYLESRRADFDDAGNEVPPKDGIWKLWDRMGEGHDESAAMREYGDSTYERAQSTHEIHAEHSRFLREERLAYEEKAKAEKTLRHSAPVEELRRQFTARYEDALKKAKLYSKAQKGIAPPDKIEAIRTRLKAEYNEMEPAAVEEEKRLKAVIQTAEKVIKRKFQASTRVCR